MFNQFEVDQSASYSISKQFLYFQPASHYVELIIVGGTGINFVIQFVVQIVTNQFIVTCQQFQFVTAQTKLCIFSTIAVEHQGLFNGVSVIQHHHLDFFGIVQLIQHVGASRLCSLDSSRCALIDFELHIAEGGLLQFIIVIGATGEYHCHSQQEDEQRSETCFKE